MSRRRLLALAAAGAGLVTVSACSTSPGAAALVGNDRISSASLQHDVSAALSNPQAARQVGANRAAFTRSLLAKEISDRVTAAAAAARGVRVTPAQVALTRQQFIQQSGGTVAGLDQQAEQQGVPVAQLPAYLRSYTLQQQLGIRIASGLPATQAQLRSEYQKDIDSYDQVDSAQILVKTRSLAQRLLGQVKADPASFAGLAQRYSTDRTSGAAGGNLGYAGRGQLVPGYANAIFANPPGSFVIAHTQYGYHVIHVIARRTVTLAQATPQLKASLFPTQVDAALQHALTAEAARLGVHVNPRYGRWDPASLQVAPTVSAISSPAG